MSGICTCKCKNWFVQKGRVWTMADLFAGIGGMRLGFEKALG